MNSTSYNAELDPKRVAFEIVSAFRESLEQGESGIFDDIGNSNSNSNSNSNFSQVGFGGGIGGGGGGLGGGGCEVVEVSSDKALEAAQISVEYCNDAEIAVSILLLSNKWMAATQIALRTNRRDLLLGEVSNLIRCPFIYSCVCIAIFFVI